MCYNFFESNKFFLNPKILKEIHFYDMQIPSIPKDINLLTTNGNHINEDKNHKTNGKKNGITSDLNLLDPTLEDDLDSSIDSPRSGTQSISTKKRRRSKKGEEKMSDEEAEYDRSCLETEFPSELEVELLCAIFSIGLKESSPKILLDLMPKDSGLSNEHIKSHLQKYRIHCDRSKEEFLQYWSDTLAPMYREWEARREWESLPPTDSNQDGNQQDEPTDCWNSQSHRDDVSGGFIDSNDNPYPK